MWLLVLQRSWWGLRLSLIRGWRRCWFASWAGFKFVPSSHQPLIARWAPESERRGWANALDLPSPVQYPVTQGDPMNRFTSALGLIAAAALASCATKPTPLTYEESASVRTTMRVEALNQGSRMITLRDSSGYSTTYHVSPEVARLNEVKVG